MAQNIPLRGEWGRATVPGARAAAGADAAGAGLLVAARLRRRVRVGRQRATSSVAGPHR